MVVKVLDKSDGKIRAFGVGEWNPKLKHCGTLVRYEANDLRKEFIAGKRPNTDVGQKKMLANKV